MPSRLSSRFWIPVKLWMRRSDVLSSDAISCLVNEREMLLASQHVQETFLDIEAVPTKRRLFGFSV